MKAPTARRRRRRCAPTARAGLLACAVFCAAVAGAATACAGPAEKVRIMPLGDSITDGSDLPGGYRIDLWQRLAAGGHRADFVGSLTNGPAALGNGDHEGHPGWRIDELNGQIAGWLAQSTPGTVLLHIGTNDVYQGYDLAGAPARLSTLLDAVVAAQPGVHLFVAQLTPAGDQLLDARVQQFNAAIPAIVRQKAAAGHRVHLVDMHSALTTADLADSLHPNASGYRKMAAVWYEAMQSVPASLTASTGGR